MKPRTPLRYRLPLLAGAVCAALLSGCGSPTAQVSGRVEYADGTPLPGPIRRIAFQPTDDSTAEVRKTASGTIEEDGSFTLHTRKAGDGVYKGKYVVTIMVLKDPRAGGLLIPEKYTLAGETPFQAEITGDRDDLLFQLDKQ